MAEASESRCSVQISSISREGIDAHSKLCLKTSETLILKKNRENRVDLWHTITTQIQGASGRSAAGVAY